MKKHLLLLFAALLPLVASAEKVEIDGIWYNLISKTKQAEVTFKGDSYNSYYDEYSGSITIPGTSASHFRISWPEVHYGAIIQQQG